MKRRTFVCTAAGAIVELCQSLRSSRALGAGTPGNGVTDGCIFVSPDGDDGNSGTESEPLRTFRGAQLAARELKKQRSGELTVYCRAGTYYLPETVVFTPEDSGEQQAPIVYASYPGEQVVLSGGSRIEPHWTPYRDDILQTPGPPGTDTDQLFVNGKRQVLARYPNYDPNARYLNGWAADAISPERVKRWADPRGGYIQALQEFLWGSLSYEITGKDANGNLTYVGGWQTNRPALMHKEYRYVENIFEELDAPGEWFLDKKKNILYYYPPDGLDMENVVVEVARLKHLVEMRGTSQSPVRWISLRNLIFRHTLRTFMKTREPLLRSDWCIYRGGALFFAGTEDCRVEECMFDQLGGNCVFVSNYNRRFHAIKCHLAEACANGIAFVGDPNAVRSPLFNYDERHTIEELDLAPGPKSDNYPKDCSVDDCLIYRTGRVEKQTAPIEIDMARCITVRHVSAYDVPRAGINIGDGCWGGHLVDSCDIFDTVMETGDHGSFNSWGRDRWWETKGIDFDTLLYGKYADLPVLDAIEPNTLSNTRWRCDHGWDIDLDDGSSNYRIYGNLCLNGGLKLREGFYRTCHNNVLVNNSLHAHVWFNDSRNIFRSNIVCMPYQPIGMRGWTQQIDFNLLHDPGRNVPTPAISLQKLSGQDEHSLEADARFIDVSHGDYNVRPDSPAFQLGFSNLDIREFGVQCPKLRAIARTPELPALLNPKAITLQPNAVNALKANLAQRSASTAESTPKGFWIQNWNNAQQKFTWMIQVPRADEYSVDVLISGAPGSQIEIVGPSNTIRVIIPEGNDHWGNNWNKISVPGWLSLPPGTSTIMVCSPNPAGIATNKDQYKGMALMSVEMIARSQRGAIEKRIRDSRSSAKWLADAQYGLMFQWGEWGYPEQGEGKPWPKVINDFNVQKFADMVQSTGAGYVIWSATWRTYYFPGPIEAVERIMPGRISKRDLVWELAEALNRRGIKLMLYYNCGYGDREWSSRNFDTTDPNRIGTDVLFRENWVAIITEVGEHYGSRLAGWFIDEGWYPSPFEELNSALKAGYPARIVSFNDWVRPRLTDFEDIEFGEAFNGLNFGGEKLFPDGPPIAGDGVYVDGPHKGLQAHGMFILDGAGYGPEWGIWRPDTAIAKPRYTSEQIVKMAKNAKVRNVALSFDLLMYEDGAVSQASLDAVRLFGKTARES